MQTPSYQTLLIKRDAWRLHITLHRPHVHNAMNQLMVRELLEVSQQLHAPTEVRMVVLRGSGGNFCAGADIKEMISVAQQNRSDDEVDPLIAMNRQFGHLLEQINYLPQPVLVILEGTIMGGGFGLACVSDIALAHQQARFRLPETSLGLLPAQIAPFLVDRMGLTNARRFAVTGGEIDGLEALRLGLVHDLFTDEDELLQKLAKRSQEIARCAPQATAMSKKLVLRAFSQERSQLLDQAAVDFAQAARSPEALEGMRSFTQKRRPSWSEGSF